MLNWATNLATRSHALRRDIRDTKSRMGLRMIMIALSQLGLRMIMIALLGLL
jgi:hypothetical protein